jgi:hypothetical protein
MKNIIDIRTNVIDHNSVKINKKDMDKIYLLWRLNWNFYKNLYKSPIKIGYSTN